MDDVLREKILASLDRPADSASDRALAKALSRDPAAKAYAAALRADDKALRAWPTRGRSAEQWDAAASSILAALDAEAKIPGGERIPPGETDHLAPPAFHDDDASPMETRPAMSEPNEHDPDLENLAALTRTSLAPGAVPSVRPHPVASIVDDADDTSSGIVDIKQLSAIARDAAASAPPPAAEPVKEAPKAEVATPRETPKADAKPAAKKDDVMVVAKPAAVPLPDAPPPSRIGGPVWAIGGMVVMAAAFFVYNSTQSSSPTSSSAVDSNTPTATAAPAEPPAPAPVAVTPPPPVAQPESAPVAAAAPAAPPPAAEAAPMPEPVAQAAPVQAHAAAAPAERAVARREHAEPARPAAAPAPTAPAPVVAAAPPPTTPAPAAPRAAAPAAAAGAPASARPAAGGGSLDDIMNRVAPNTAAPAPAAAAAPATDLPVRLGRAQITGVLAPLNGAVRSCAQGETGTAPVAIVIGNDGAVRSATVSGQFAGTPVGTCIEGVVRRAHFPAFSSPTQNLMFPYVITPPR